MEEISLRKFLEAGCHFGHKASKWHPKAASFIYQVREGFHIIDLAETKKSLEKAAEFVKKLGEEEKLWLLVGTKRQARGVLVEAAKRGGLPYFVNRWIGGFFTNWDEVKKNLEKLNRMEKEKNEGTWQKFPKHEQRKLEKAWRKLEEIYGGVKTLSSYPAAIFIVDIKKEASCLKEARKKEIPTIAIIDTNADPNLVDFPIPANDDAVGSIQLITNFLVSAFLEGRKKKEKVAVEGGKEKGEEKKKMVKGPIKADLSEKEEKKKTGKENQGKKEKKSPAKKGLGVKEKRKTSSEARKKSKSKS